MRFRVITGAILIAFVLSAALNSTTILEDIENKWPYYFGDVFTEEIYHLDVENEYDVGPDLSKKEKQEIDCETNTKVKLLIKRKINAVQKTLIARIESYKEELRTKRSDDGKCDAGKTALSGGLTLAAAKGAALLEGSTAVAGATEASTALISATEASTALVGATEASTALSAASWASPMVIGAVGTYFVLEKGGDMLFNYLYHPNLREIEKCDKLITKLKEELKKEKIAGLEKEYIENQNTLSEHHRLSIETELIKARKKPDFGQTVPPEAKVREILDFPKAVLALPPGVDVEAIERRSDYAQKREEFLDEIFPSLAEEKGSKEKGKEKESKEKVSKKTVDGKLKLDSEFYDEQLRKNLKDLMRTICNYSYKACCGDPEPVLMRGVIFYGKPGTGKTMAVDLIAKALKLPLYKLDITSEYDYMDSSLYGEPASTIKNGKKGSLTKAFLQKNSQGKTGKNVIIFMDDIDRGFMNRDKEINLKGLKKFLHDIFDISKKTFDAEYYGIPDFDFSNVIIIAAVNTDIRLDTECSGLRSRCIFIPFGSPPLELHKSNIRKFLTDLDFELSTIYGDRTGDWDGIRDQIADFIIDKYDIDDNRQRKLRAHQLLEVDEKAWDDFAQKQDWSANSVVH